MNKLWILVTALFVVSCGASDDTPDAYGNFEADDVLISAESNGKITFFNIEEGDRLKAGQLVAITDTLQLHLKKAQLEASIRAIQNKTQDVQAQIDVLEEQKKTIQREVRRVEALVKEEAATQKQLDDLQGELEIVEKRINATRTQLETNNSGLLSEIEPLKVQIAQIEDQIDKCKIINPVNGTVLGKYAEPGEITTFGRPLYKIADLDKITLRAYVSETQLAAIKIGQEMVVRIDDGEHYKTEKGKLTWISDEAEFTPKEIQTKEARVNLVYAIKVVLPNDGAFKIGMPGEIVW
ncbi:MAG TPA: HlyD family secretion protein [Cytophagales bacterium]|jgi:HlyD family secretion protein|nr:HlyD family secretion protein [Cytophagales bacterium]